MLNDDGGERLLGLGVFGLARIFLTERGGNRGAALAPPVEVVACLNLYRRLVEIVAADRSGEQTGTGIATPVAIGVEGRVDAFFGTILGKHGMCRFNASGRNLQGWRIL
jgi:hypothetical protein